MIAMLASAPRVAVAGPILWIDDSAGRIGTVDVATGAATFLGNSGVILTDIAFDPNGQLYGTSFTSLYHIDKTTGTATLIGNNGVGSINALTFGADGTLYAAASSTTNLYSLNPTTGAATVLGNIGFTSAGDLAFHNGNLYESSTNNHLLKINLASVSATDIGPFGFSSVYGLANGDNSVLYGVAGTNVFSVDTLTGLGTLVSNYGGGSLAAANGSAFFRETVTGSPVPEPSSLTLVALGIAGLFGVARWKRRSNANAGSGN